ncbi:MAG: glycosyltransferase family 2 protein [Deltaproteobacteria bacterium]|nr:glycosyltransferase family 2 protein [Deltaproteobacteria bacterium]
MLVMNRITAIMPYRTGRGFRRMVEPLIESSSVGRIIVIHGDERPPSLPKCEARRAPSFYDGRTWNELIEEIRTGFFLLIRDGDEVEAGSRALERLLETAQIRGAGMVYTDYWEEGAGGCRLHPVNDHQPGSLRDTFDFGPAQLFSTRTVRKAIRRHGAVADCRHAGLYDLRLKLSLEGPLFHLPETLFTVRRAGISPPALDLFSYVDPDNQAAQQEMEAAVTAHLKRIDAWIGPPFEPPPTIRKRFPVEASVVIPVRNRATTIAEAVRSALDQKTDFPFNVIVVDNHSTDGTAKALSKLSRTGKVIHHVPARTDLGIGGCWNEAIALPSCGRWTVQLDSDDLYSGPDSLQQLVSFLRQGRFAMVVGAYTLVDECFEMIPPGLVAHREWTDDNGPNNALRVNGFGAPRAFDTALIRKIGFLNVSYGEDYALALRISRRYRIGRIYESLYLCRRWSGNTDADLSIYEANRNDAFKDTIRTLEILARQKRNREAQP